MSLKKPSPCHAPLRHAAEEESRDGGEISRQVESSRAFTMASAGDGSRIVVKGVAIVEMFEQHCNAMHARLGGWRSKARCTSSVGIGCSSVRTQLSSAKQNRPDQTKGGCQPSVAAKGPPQVVTYKDHDFCFWFRLHLESIVFAVATYRTSVRARS